jgi:glycosyltransferase involved in cell wall biosynthesis
VPEPPSLPGLRLHGSLQRSQLIEHYRTCDLFIAPSLRQESFGIVLLEAMASGAAIVCSDIRGYREVAQPEGATFVPPSDPEQLAAAIATLAVDPARRAAMQAFNLLCVAAYRWPVLAERVREHYLAAIAETRRLVGRAQPEGLLEGAFAVSSNKRLLSTNPSKSTGMV